MSPALSRIIEEIILAEGGYSYHPEDRGGATKYGITAETLGEFRRLGRAATAAEVAALTMDEASEIYREMYYRRPGFEAIQDAVLLHLVMDSAVHSGPRTVIRWIQTALGVVPDGIIGPMTRSILVQADAARLYRAVLAARMRHIGHIITKRRAQAVFVRGWMARLAGFVERCP